MSTPISGRMTAVMDQLVAAARSSRDGAFNAIDAVNRQTRASYAELQDEVKQKLLEYKPKPDAKPGEGDAQQQGADATAPAPDPSATPAARDTGAAPDTGAARDTRFDPEDEWEVAGTTAPQGPTGSGRRLADDDADGDADDDDGEEFTQTWLR